MQKIVIAYIPVLHKGYFDFLASLKDRGVDALYLIGDEILTQFEELDYLNRKDRLRAMPVRELMSAVAALTDIQVYELTATHIADIQKSGCIIVTPQEDIGTVVVNAFFKTQHIEWVSIFLRWNKENAEANKEPETDSQLMTVFQKKIIDLMYAEANKSFDWWRQVGAALIQDGEIIYVTHNEHMPEEQTPNIDGDVRSLFKKGININYSTAAHAEVIALGGAARAGIKTEGAELYVTDFPCPYCARLIASAGIGTVYFLKGYAVLEGDSFLKGAGVRVVRLQE